MIESTCSAHNTPAEPEGAYALRRFPRAVQRIDTHVSCPQFIHAANSPTRPLAAPQTAEHPRPETRGATFQDVLKSLIAAQFTGHGSTNTPHSS